MNALALAGADPAKVVEAALDALDDVPGTAGADEVEEALLLARQAQRLAESEGLFDLDRRAKAKAKALEELQSEHRRWEDNESYQDLVSLHRAFLPVSTRRRA